MLLSHFSSKAFAVAFMRWAAFEVAIAFFKACSAVSRAALIPCAELIAANAKSKTFFIYSVYGRWTLLIGVGIMEKA